MKQFFYAVLSAIFIFIMSTGFGQAQPDTQDVKIETLHVAGPVYMLTGSGGNIGVSTGQDGTLLIDDQYAPLSVKIQGALDVISQGPFRFVLNTHWHHDHTGGNEAFGRRAPIIAQTNVRQRLLKGGSFPLIGMELPPVGPEFLPVLTYDDGVSLHLNGENIKVMHMPNAHTDGDSVVIFTGSRAAHLGDLMFSGMFPFVDIDSGGDVEGLINHIGYLLKTLPRNVKIIPGHGPLSGYEDLQRYHEMLVETTSLIRQHVVSGKSADEAVQAGLPEKWSAWGHGFINAENWIRIVHRSYSQE